MCNQTHGELSCKIFEDRWKKRTNGILFRVEIHTILLVVCVSIFSFILIKIIIHLYSSQ